MNDGFSAAFGQSKAADPRDTKKKNKKRYTANISNKGAQNSGLHFTVYIYFLKPDNPTANVKTTPSLESGGSATIKIDDGTEASKWISGKTSTYTVKAEAVYEGGISGMYINYAGDVDVFRFRPLEKDSYFFESTGATDMYGSLYRPGQSRIDGTLLSNNDNFAAGKERSHSELS